MKSLVISRTHGRYHNWQLIAKELGHELNNKQCCQRWKSIKHRYVAVNKKKRPISDISGNENTIDDEEDSCAYDGNQFLSPLHSVVVEMGIDEMNHLLSDQGTHQPVTAEEVLATINMMMMNENSSNMIGQQHNRKYDLNVEKAFLNQKRKKEPHEIRTKWTPAMVRDSMNTILYYTILIC